MSVILTTFGFPLEHLMLTPSRPWRRRALGLISGGLLGGLLASDVEAQGPPLPGPLAPPPVVAPQPMLPPLMFVRLAGPKGMKATFFRGGPKGQTVETPCVVGLRPGYTYRIALADVPAFPGRVFFPTLEVRASLMLESRLRNAQFPATLAFSDEDFERAHAGALIRKVIVLERPENAIPVPSKAEEPLEVRVPPARDPLAEAQDRGQPLVLVQFGERDWTAEELAFSGISGTVLMPGEKVLAPPRLPPSGPWACFPVVDPVTGPLHPDPFMCLPDGGDTGLPVGFGPDGKLRGLDPADTVAEYFDSKGRRRLAVSNRVCLCVPRFIITRGETLPSTQIAMVGPGMTQITKVHDMFVNRQALLTQEQRMLVEMAKQKLQPSATSNLYGAAVVGRVQGVEVKVSLRTVGA
jgi:hypothetical protein